MMTSFIPHFPETAASGRKSAGAIRPLSPGIRRALSTVLLTLALSVLGILLPAGAAPVQAMHNGKTVIVLDPGHGGSDIGANYAPYVEKAMTLCTAIYLYQELSQYDNVEVYLTRTEDKDVSLAERVDFAHSVNADFLLSLHFNAVGTGEVKSGSMILPSAFGSLYSQECSYGLLNLQQLSAIGLKSHGFWTRLGRTGADYFGIIRRSTNTICPLSSPSTASWTMRTTANFLLSPIPIRSWHMQTLLPLPSTCISSRQLSGSITPAMQDLSSRHPLPAFRCSSIQSHDFSAKEMYAAGRTLQKGAVKK